jgi:uncharacterized protein
MHNKRSRQAAHEFQFNVAQLLKEVTGATRGYQINNAAIGKLDEDITLISPLVGQVKFLYTGSDILVTGSLAGTIKKSCGRCLITFTALVSIELEEQFHPTIDVNTGSALPLPADVDEANEIDAQHILDLLEVVRQGILLESDNIRYCRVDCKGLCPQCGQDRNIDPCTCEENTIDLRWTGLQALQESVTAE